MGNVEKLLQCFKELGIQLHLEDFSERKRIQKIVCLLQYTFGIRLDYGFSWYIHGPYSPDLTRTLFEMPKNETRRPEVLTKKDKDRIGAFRDFVGESLNSSRDMELMASLYYLYYLGKRSGASEEEILNTFREKKSFFSYEEVQKAWERRIIIDPVPE